MLVALRQAESQPVELHLPVEVWFVVALVAVLVAAALARALDQGGRRDRAIRAAATRRGWRWQSDDPAGLGDLRFRTFGGAKGALVTNVVTVGDGRVRAFDYSLLVERSARDPDASLGMALADDVFGVEPARPRTTKQPTRRRTGVVVRVDAFCPSLVAAPASALSRVVEGLGASDRDFESVEFNRKWDVRCGDERFAWLFCDASMIDLVLSLGPGVTLETFGNYVLFARDLVVDADRLMAFVAEVARVPEVLNPLVRAEYPTVTEMESRTMMAAWQNRPDGRHGEF